MFISICIPAYKNLLFVERLLSSIAIQSFRDFEVVITDDSPDDELEKFISNYESTFKIQYFKNSNALGTPENWNASIRNAKGQWIKLMHDDDWFADEDCLKKFAETAQHNSASFIFSAYENIYLEENKAELIIENKYSYRFWQLKKNVASLLSKNIIGPPSVAMHLNNGKYFYDKQLKWLVDIDFYYHNICKEKVYYITQPLINVGLGKEQVTQACFRIAEVEIPEYFYFMNKIGWKNLNNILVYDASWRLFRNLGIKKNNDVVIAGYHDEVPSRITSMINFQNKLPNQFLKIGFISKLFMLFHYLFFRKIKP